MDQVRKPFQGVWNIIRFNWHFYVFALAVLLVFLWLHLLLVAVLIMLPLVISLLVSFYIYDRSGLYNLSWASGLPAVIVNIHAGFDETSIFLKRRFPGAALLVFDFYDPIKHTEVSIKRARRAYPPFPGTQSINTRVIPVPDGQVDQVFVILSAHEIRDPAERRAFFIELKRILKADGRIFVTEHLRDLPNFLAYTIGFFHFHARSSWYLAFQQSDLLLAGEIKPNPFISTFILEKHGDRS